MKIILKIITSLFIALFYVFMHDGPTKRFDEIGYGCIIFGICLYVLFFMVPSEDEVEILEEYSREPEDPEEILP